MAKIYEKITDNLVKITDSDPTVVVLDVTKIQGEISRLTSLMQRDSAEFDAKQKQYQAQIDKLSSHFTALVDAKILNVDGDLVSAVQGAQPVSVDSPSA